MTRRYLDDTNVVESVYRRRPASLVSPPRSTWVRPAGSPGPNSPNESMSWPDSSTSTGNSTRGTGSVEPPRGSPDRNGTPVASIEDQTLGVVLDGLGSAVITPHGVSGRRRLGEGTRALLAVVATDAEPLFIPTPDAIQSRLDRTIGSW